MQIIKICLPINSIQHQNVFEYNFNYNRTIPSWCFFCCYILPMQYARIITLPTLLKKLFTCAFYENICFHLFLLITKNRFPLHLHISKTGCSIIPYGSFPIKYLCFSVEICTHLLTLIYIF